MSEKVEFAINLYVSCRYNIEIFVARSVRDQSEIDLSKHSRLELIQLESVTGGSQESMLIFVEESGCVDPVGTYVGELKLTGRRLTLSPDSDMIVVPCLMSLSTDYSFHFDFIIKIN